jgi:hypothetical protein
MQKALNIDRQPGISRVRAAHFWFKHCKTDVFTAVPSKSGPESASSIRPSVEFLLSLSVKKRLPGVFPGSLFLQGGCLKFFDFRTAYERD